MITEENVLLTTQEAAKRLKISPRTMELWRYEGKGPVYARIGGSVRYLISDLDAWVIQQRQKNDN